MRKIVKVFIADDHPIFRRGLVDIINDEPRFKISGEAQDGAAALQMIKEQKPDIAILDIEMPGMNGLEIAEALLSENSTTDIVILTMYKDEEYFDKALDLEVKAYLLKDSVASELIDSLKAVTQGDFYISPVISKYLIERNKNKTREPEEQAELEILTNMEKHVLKLLAENKTSREIADETYTSIRTVQNHRTNMCAKLNLKGYNKLLQFAIQNKFILEQVKAYNLNPPQDSGKSQ
jgi:DNA-binding NarL/FixJ family response regulator